MKSHLFGYTVANGVKASDYPYDAEVETQEEIDKKKESLMVEHENSKVWFKIKTHKGSKLQP